MAPSNGARGYQPAQPARGRGNSSGGKGQIVILAVCLIVLALLIGFIVNLVACHPTEPADTGNKTTTEVTAPENKDAVETVADKPAGEVGKKLEGATETVDKNGVVHGESKDGVKYVLYGRGESGKHTDKVTLAAVGDQIATDNSLPIADAYAGGTGDGKYDFAPFYKGVKKFINKSDLRFINQETVMATDGHNSRISGYPLFNSPNNMAKTIDKVGFNMVTFCSNHLFDAGTSGIKKSHKIWKKYPNLLVAGSYTSQSDRNTIRLIERNGITFALLAYSYGDNFYAGGKGMPNDYFLATFNKKKMKKEIKRAQSIADAVIVYMHWGSEYDSTPNQQQLRYASWLADQNVDLVLGSHAHITQPVKLVKGKKGNVVPVVFGMSDFVSGWTLTDTILSGIFTCDFVKTDDGIEVKNPIWYPCIEWSKGGRNVYVRRLCDMTKAEINANTRTQDVSNDYAYIKKAIKAMKFDIPVKMKPKA